MFTTSARYQVRDTHTNQLIRVLFSYQEALRAQDAYQRETRRPAYITV